MRQTVAVKPARVPPATKTIASAILAGSAVVGEVEHGIVLSGNGGEDMIAIAGN